MLKKKKDNKKRNIAIGATGLAATGLGAAYLLSRKKPPTSTLSNLAKNTSNTENLISKNIDKSPINLGVENVTGLKKQTKNVWDKVAQKLDALPSVKRARRGQQLLTASKPPKGLLRAGYDTPQVDWETPVPRANWDNIGAKINAKRQGLLTGVPTPKALPAKTIKANVAVKGYRRADGTFVSSYQRRIDKVLRENRLRQIAEGLTAESTSLKNSATRPTRLWQGQLDNQVAAKVRERTKEVLEKQVDIVQARNYTRPVLVESGEINIDPGASDSAKQLMREKHRNVSVRRANVQRLTTDADNLARELEEVAQKRFAERKGNFAKKLDTLKQELKKYEPDVFEKPLSADKFDVRVKQLQNDLEKTLTDPFAPNYFDDSRTKIKQLKQELATELAQIDNKITQPQQYLQRAESLIGEIDTLRQQYREVLNNVYAENVDRVTTMREQLQQEQQILAKLTNNDITEKFIADEKNVLLAELDKRANKQFFGNYSNSERQLRRLRTQVVNTRSTAKVKANNPQPQLEDYRAQISSLQTLVNNLPVTRRNLTKAQRLQLKRTESFPRTYKKLYGDLAQNIENLHAYEKDFTERYTSLVKEIDNNADNIFSNQTFDDYMDEIEKGADTATALYSSFRQNADTVNKIYDPNEVITRYLDLVNRVKDVRDIDLASSMVPFSKESNNVMLTEIAKRKKVVMRGGYIGDKRFDGVLKDLGIARDVGRVRAGLLNSGGEEYLQLKRSVVDYNDARLATLADEYVTRKKQLLREIDKSMAQIGENIDYETWRQNPEAGFVVGKLNDLVEKYNNDFGVNDVASSFFKQKQVLNDAQKHLQDIAQIKPQFEIVDDNIRLKTIGAFGEKTSELNKTLVEKVNKEYAQVVAKTRSKRLTMANLYYNLDKAGLQVEGNDNFFKRLRRNKLTPDEQQYLASLPQNDQNILRNFSTYQLDDQFQKYYYVNAMSHSLRGNKSTFTYTDDVVKAMGENANPVMARVNDFIGRTKPVDLQRRKLREVQSTLRDLRSLGEDVKLTAFMSGANGERIPFQNGMLGVSGLPPILPGEQYRNRNFMVRKLRKLMGVREDGAPLYNPRLARTLSGVDVSNRDELKELLRDVESKYYEESDLNTMYVAAQLNNEFLRNLDAGLYLYNFSRNDANIVTF